MNKRRRLLQRALLNPAGLRFSELCSLAKQLGFEHDRTGGSHHIYIHRGLPRPLNFQDMNGMAKPFQVKQLLEAARELDLLRDED